MTREEREDAIDIIQSILDKYEENECLVAEITIGDEDIKALKMAIKALEQEPTTKNNLGVDCVARQDVERYIEGFINEYTPTEELEFINLELDGLKHIPSVTPQEPFINKPCVSSEVCEHDKQMVLDKIRADIKSKITRRHSLKFTISERERNDAFLEVLDIIDKYNAESEDKE